MVGAREPTAPPLEVRSLTKRFGAKVVLSEINFSVRAGEVYGLLGANGAGKTTTIRCVSGLLQPNRGHIRVSGLDVVNSPQAARRRLGVLYSEPGLYDRLTAVENVLYFASLNGVPESEALDRTLELLDYFQLSEKDMHRYVGTFSKGMKQKVAIVRAVVHDPPVLIFDEATVGLDVHTVLAVEEFVLQMRERGKAVVWTTHNMRQVEKLCSRVGILVDGRMVADDLTEEIMRQEGSLEAAFLKVSAGAQQ